MERFLRVILAVSGGFLGFQGASLIEREMTIGIADTHYFSAALIVGGALFGFILAPLVIGNLRRSFGRLVLTIYKIPTENVTGGAIGLVLGLLIAILVTRPLPDEIPLVGQYLPVIITLLLGYLAMSVGVRKGDELLGVFNRSTERVLSAKDKKRSGNPKVLDTSVIIDGRIADITKSGFIEGPLIVPSFVLEELQHIADSSDALKRNRGRRGLDVLNKIQKEPYVSVQIMEKDYEEISEVDSKLVKLAKELVGKVITNDYNLNKVCELQGVAVLNINELANAVKPVVLPGEELRVHVIKDGKEQGQGVAYLDDGTMIVVDGGRRFIGDTICVLVTSVLQTAAGRMIFAKPKAMEKAL